MLIIAHPPYVEGVSKDVLSRKASVAFDQYSTAIIANRLSNQVVKPLSSGMGI